MSTDEERAFDSAGVPIHYRDLGDGRPVVLVHGFTGFAEMWGELPQSLSDRRRVIAIDCRGHGQSGKPHERDAYGLSMAVDLDRLLDHLDIESADLVGYSMGAEIALKLTTHLPHRVSSLVIGGSGWSRAEGYALYERLAASLETDRSFGALIRELAPPDAPAPSDEEIRALDEMLAGNDIDALVAVARGMDGLLDITAEDLRAIGVPVLGLAGENDPERPNIEMMADLVADFSLTILAGRDHMSALEDPQFDRDIIAFLDQQV